jgi:branched-chain amino acid transport system permease protein
MQFALQNVISAISLGSLYALVALAITIIFGIMQLVNFAHGELIMVGGYALFYVIHQPWPLWIVTPVVTAAVFAFAMERVAFRPVRGANAATLLVTSFALSYLLQNLTNVIIGPAPKGVPLSGFVTRTFTIGDVQIQNLSLLTLLTTFGLLAGLRVFLKKTALGVQMRAAAEDFDMTRLLGVRANTVIASAFVISGLLAGVVSFLFISQTGQISPTLGLVPLLAGIVAMVIGGMGSLPGAVLGGYVLGGMTIALQALLPLSMRGFRDAFTYWIVILILLVRPQGILPAQAWKVRV